MNRVLRHLRRAALLSVGEGPSDDELLESFLVRRDEAAFEAILQRHGPMVLGVCRRVLRNLHDAEDAFQATFLVLARKASSIRSRQVVASWLYGVAYRTAMKARVMNVKRRTKERQAGELPRSESSADEELLEQLDHELNRLPDKYRVPVVLCELEGRTRKEAARMLAIPEGTLSWRLAQAKKLLARRLSRYGTVAMTALLAESTASACLSPILRASTAKAALTAGIVPAHVLALTEEVMKAMLLTKLKITVCAAALMLLAGVGATGLTYRATAQQPRQEAALASRPQADELEVLRLEIEALRKSLQATRERVRTLEDEVRTLKRTDRDPVGMMPGVGPTKEMAPSLGSARPMEPQPAGTQSAAPTAGTQSAAPTAGTQSAAPTAGTQSAAPKRRETQLPAASGSSAIPAPRPQQSNIPPSNSTETATDSLTHAEKALKQLRANPNDTKAIETLERALKQLKEREKPAQGNNLQR